MLNCVSSKKNRLLPVVRAIVYMTSVINYISK